MSDFKITCSIAKAYEKSDGSVLRRYISGLASGTKVDLDGERMAESAIKAFQKAIQSGMTLNDGQWSLIPLRSGHRTEWDDILGWLTKADVDTDHNLWIEAELDLENPVAAALYKKLTRSPEVGKPVKLGLSVGGTVLKAGYEWDDEHSDFMKTYYDVELREVSVVSQPAYPTSYLQALNKSVNWDTLKPTPVFKAEDSFTPTSAMKSAARRALNWKEEGKAGGTRIGLTRANQIVNGTALSLSTVKRMYSFFSRHEVDKKATGFSQGEEGYPSPGRVAWDLWGGDAGFTWSRTIVDRAKKSEDGEDIDLMKDFDSESLPAYMFEPTEAMKSSVERALLWAEHQPVSENRDIAAKIASDDRLSMDDVKQMHAYFETHELDKHQVGFFSEQAGYPIVERVLWDLYGGDPGFRWATERLGMKIDAEAGDADHTVLALSQNKENTTMENTEEITKTQTEVETDVVEEVTKTETLESQLDDVAVDIDLGVQVDTSAIEQTVKSLMDEVSVLSKTVSQLAEQLMTEKSVTEAQDDAVEKAKNETNQIDLVKTAIVSALEPIMQRLDRIENEPVDRSYAVLKNKYEDDEPFEVRIQREIDAVDGRDAVKRALQIAFNGQS